MGNSKIIYGGEVLIDLTADTVTEDKLLKGYTAHGADGDPVVGACTYDADTQDATAADAEILSGKTAYVKGSKKTGTMKNNGAVSGVISTKDGAYTVPHGFHDGSGKVAIADAEQAKITPSNIRAGITILGVEGTMSGTEGANAQTKSVTPSKTQQSVVPDDGYNYLSEVIVEAIPYSTSGNDAGGTTVMIG